MQPMTYEEAKVRRAELINATAAAGLILHSIRGIGTGPMGLTPDAIKFSPEYVAAKIAWNIAFGRERRFNSYFVKTFAREYRADRDAKRQAMQSAQG